MLVRITRLVQREEIASIHIDDESIDELKGIISRSTDGSDDELLAFVENQEEELEWEDDLDTTVYNGRVLLFAENELVAHNVPGRCTFISEWSDGSWVQTYCTLHGDGSIDAEPSFDDSDHGSLVSEKIVTSDMKEHKVCMECHSSILVGEWCPKCKS